MQRIRTHRTIHGALDEVFRSISDVRNFRQAVPHITKIEFLTDQQAGVGTRFLETRLMQGREQTVELEVAEYVENDRIRMRSDAGGTLWDSLFTVSAGASGVTLEMQMDIQPKLLPPQNCAGSTFVHRRKRSAFLVVQRSSRTHV